MGLTALEPVANRPIIHHALDRILYSSHGGVVVAGGADALEYVRASLEDYDPGPVPIEYLGCRIGAGAPRFLRELEPLVRGRACLIQPADGILDEPLAELMDIASGDRSDVLVVEKRANQPRADQTIDDPELARSDRRDLAAGVVVLARGALMRAAEALQGEPGIDLAGACAVLSERGFRVRQHEADGWHRYRGHGSDLLELNRMALDRLVGHVPEPIRRHNRIEGNVAIDPTARVRSSVVIGPAVIGPNAVVTEAYLGPYTSIGAGAHIEGSEVERSIVSPGASVIHVGSRLVSSLVGRDTRVFRHFALPRALRLWVGDGDEVALC